MKPEADQAAPAASDAVAQSAPASPKFEIVELDTPIMRGAQKIASVEIRKPFGGDMRGLSLQAIQQADINAMIVLIPKVTNPPLTPHEVETALEPADLLSIAGTISGFFFSKADRAMLGKVLGQIEQETSTS